MGTGTVCARKREEEVPLRAPLAAHETNEGHARESRHQGRKPWKSPCSWPLVYPPWACLLAPACSGTGPGSTEDTGFQKTRHLHRS